MNRNVVLVITLLTVGCLANVYGDGLIAYYSFDNALNPGHDDSGNGHNLTMSGTWSVVAGFSGGALHTETSSTQAPHANTSGMNYPTQNGFSVEYWFKMGASSDQIAVRDYWAGQDSGETFGLRYNPTQSKADFFVRHDFSPPTIVEATVTGNVGDWIHLMGIYDPAGYAIKLYINQILADQGNMPGPMRSQIAPYLYIQGSSHGTDQGTVDEVKLYDYAVPEPATLLLLGLGGLALRKRGK